MLIRLLLSWILLLSTYNGFAQEKFTIVKDLRSEWLVFSNNQYEKASADKRPDQSVHFIISKSQFPAGNLLVKSSAEHRLFLNGKLLGKAAKYSLLSIDSLYKKYQSSTLNLTVYQPAIDAAQLQTMIVQPRSASDEDMLKPRSTVKDFVSSAGLLVIIFFVAIIRVNPKLASDYFSIQRILSLREAEDNQSHSRFAISSNIWFYLFCSLLTALYLIMVFTHLPESNSLAIDTLGLTFGGILWTWSKLSFLIMALLMGKALAIYMLSNLFGMTGIGGVHFFNWIRFLLILCSSLVVMLFIYFISDGLNSSVYVGFQYLLLAMMATWIVVIFLKLNNRVEHSMFHLFSYICATELVPLLITIKVFFQ